MWSYAATPNLQEPPKEDQVPDDLDLENPLPFDFFGLGQPVNGPNGQDSQEQQQQDDAWDPWPTEIQAQE